MDTHVMLLVFAGLARVLIEHLIQSIGILDSWQTCEGIIKLDLPASRSNIFFSHGKPGTCTNYISTIIAKLSLNSTQFQLKLWLRLALFQTSPPTHLPTPEQKITHGYFKIIQLS